MVEAVAEPRVSALPLAPKNPLPYWHQLKSLRSFIDGFQKLRDAGGPVSRIVRGPKWLVPTAALIASPRGGRDVLGRTDEIFSIIGSMCPEIRRIERSLSGALRLYRRQRCRT